MHIQSTPSIADPDWIAVDASESNSPVGISLSVDHKSSKVLVTLTPPAAAPRAPMDICCVIDVSGSMGSEAPVPGDGGVKEHTGLSVLDVVKHSLKTIIATMKSTIAAGLTEMTTEGKASVLKTIDELSPLSSTNLWDGLKTGMNLLNDAYTSTDPGHSTTGRLPMLFVFTDGIPNIDPPRGHIPSLNAYLERHSAARAFSISTFGFGYGLDSALLLEIAQVGGGGYSFIPDAGMVGTVFVHSMANAYATYAPRATLSVEVPEGVEVKVEGMVGDEVKRASWGLSVEAGDIQFGQTRDYVLSFPKGLIPADLGLTATFKPFTSTESLRTDTIALSHSANPPDLTALEYNSIRLSLITTLLEAKANNLHETRSLFTALEHSIASSALLSSYAPAQALARDISGQGTIGLDPAQFRRWGRHYFPSLARSHARQQCANFKDPGLQVYGKESKVFQQERDELSETFDTLPPPKPSTLHQNQPHRGVIHNMPGRGMARMMSSSVTPASRAPPSMAMYQQADGPCFTGPSKVLLADGTHARVDSLKRYSELMTLLGPREVAVVVRTAIEHGEMLLCKLGDELVLTPWHPVTQQSKWVFPTDVVVPTLQSCEAIYSLLLFPAAGAEGHTVNIGGVWCTTLGHGLVDPSIDDVRTHSYLGSYSSILRDLSRMNGFHENGVVECAGTRRDENGRISGFLAADGPEQTAALFRHQAVVCA
ncbi:hypothetical protein HWV62_23388 [Athelia sp. TMB]|nr:hypothetical protein HWV62_23388 [Athelia sp. TMB]